MPIPKAFEDDWPDDSDDKSAEVSATAVPDEPAPDEPDETPDSTEPDASTPDAPPPDSAPPSEAAEVAEPEGWLTNDLLEEAQIYRFDEQEARSFGSAENLERAMAAIDREASSYGHTLLEAQQAAQIPPAGTAPAAPAPATPATPAPAPPAGPSPLEKYNLALDPEEFDEGLVKAINGMNDHYDGVIRKQEEMLNAAAALLIQMHGNISQNTGQAMADEELRVERDMDTFFDSLGEEYQDIYGKGETRYMPAQSEELRNRQKLWEEMGVLETADAMNPNRPKSTRQQLQKRALRVLQSEKETSLARKQIAAEVKKRRGQAIARATGSRVKPVSGRDKAIATAERWYKANSASFEEPSVL